MDIRFLYFDVGGVITLDFSKTNKWDELLTDLGINESDKKKVDEIFSSLETKFCLGEKNVDSFIEILKNDYSIPISDSYSLLDDIVSRFDPNPKLSSLIINLKSFYKMGLLTNMYPFMLDKIMNRGLIPNIEWDSIIDSSTVGFVKPQKEMFQIAELKAGYSSNQILFIENTKIHIYRASELGWNTLLYDPSDIDVSNEKLLNVINKK